MPENKLVDLSMDIAVDIVNLCDSLKCKASLVDQLLRSGTSIGANIHEANYAHRKPDFVAKLQIALKECYETEYWLQLLKRTDKLAPETATEMKSKCGNIRRILIASINTSKQST